jgi:O-antigen ligase
VGIATLLLTLILVLRITLSNRPFVGWSPLLAISAVALALFAAWTLLSATWSDAPARALLEFDRALLYLLVLIVCGSVARRPGALGATLRWTALAMVLVCAAGLATRLLPGTFHAPDGVVPQRLSWPLTYWNALGILSGIGLVLSAHLTVSRDERPAVRVAAAAALPIVAVTLLLTFSRGGIAATLLALVAYLLLALPRGLLVGLVCAGIPAAVATWKAYGADRLAEPDYANAAGRAQGREVLVVLLACIAAAAVLRALGLLADRRIEAIRLPDRWRRPVLGTAVAVGIVALIAVAVAVDLPGRVGEARRSFTQGSLLTVTADTRDRLTQLGNNGRVDNWRVARDTFEAHPFKGTGAGTYRLDWEQDRPVAFQVVNAHSLYLEVLSELGIPGMAMLAIALGALLLAGILGLRGPERRAHAAFVAAGIGLLVHAGVDWDWQMPAVFLWFVAAGAVAAASAGRDRAGSLGRVPRIVAALACLLVAVTPFTIAASEGPLQASTRALLSDDCPLAVDRAIASLDRLRVRPEPFEVLGYCDARGGQAALAISAMRAAEARDPHNWQYVYGLAVVQGMAGVDPRPAAARARALNPLEPLAAELDRAVSRTESRTRWKRIATRSRIPVQ